MMMSMIRMEWRRSGMVLRMVMVMAVVLLMVVFFCGFRCPLDLCDGDNFVEWFSVVDICCGLYGLNDCLDRFLCDCSFSGGDSFRCRGSGRYDDLCAPACFIIVVV